MMPMQNNLAQRISGLQAPAMQAPRIQAPPAAAAPVNNVARPVGMPMAGPRPMMPMQAAAAPGQAAPGQVAAPQPVMSPAMPQNNLRARLGLA